MEQNTEILKKIETHLRWFKNVVVFLLIAGALALLVMWMMTNNIKLA